VRICHKFPLNNHASLFFYSLADYGEGMNGGMYGYQIKLLSLLARVF
jgi:hypothetical protein